jgi:hypothetical protein
MHKNDLLMPESDVPQQPYLAPQPNRRTRLYTSFTTTFSKRFPQFSLLPTEIRLQIWEAAMPDPRVHELHPCGKLQQGRLMFRSNSSTPPVILQVCSESREVGLRHYQLMEYEASYPSKPISKFYFNPRTDTLFLNTLTALYMTLILLEEDAEMAPKLGIMKG